MELIISPEAKEKITAEIEEIRSKNESPVLLFFLYEYLSHWRWYAHQEVKVVTDSEMKTDFRLSESAPGDHEREFEEFGESNGLSIYIDNLVKPFLPEKVEIGLKGRWRFKKLVITNISKSPFLYK